MIIIPYLSDITRIKKIVFIVYVDNIVSIGDDKEMARLKKLLAQEFEIKVLEKLQYLLAIEVVILEKGIFISQRKYI